MDGAPVGDHFLTTSGAPSFAPAKDGESRMKHSFANTAASGHPTSAIPQPLLAQWMGHPVSVAPRQTVVPRDPTYAKPLTRPAPGN